MLKISYLANEILPPSDEGGGKTAGFGGGRENKGRFLIDKLPLSLASSTAPLTSGAISRLNLKSLPLTREVAKPQVLTEGEIK